MDASISHTYICSPLAYCLTRKLSLADGLEIDDNDSASEAGIGCASVEGPAADALGDSSVCMKPCSFETKMSTPSADAALELLAAPSALLSGALRRRSFLGFEPPRREGMKLPEE